MGACRQGLQTLTLFKKNPFISLPVYDKRPLYFACVLRFLSALFFIFHTESFYTYIHVITELDFKKNVGTHM